VGAAKVPLPLPEATKAVKEPIVYDVGGAVAVHVGDGERGADGGDGGGLGEVSVAVVEQDVGGGGLAGSGALVDVDEIGIAVAVDVGGVDVGGPVAGGDDLRLEKELGGDGECAGCEQKRQESMHKAGVGRAHSDWTGSEWLLVRTTWSLTRACEPAGRGMLRVWVLSSSMGE